MRPNRFPPSSPASPTSCAARPTLLSGTGGAGTVGAILRALPPRRPAKLNGVRPLESPRLKGSDALEVVLVVPGDERPAGEVDAVDLPALAVIEQRDAGVRV